MGYSSCRLIAFSLATVILGAGTLRCFAEEELLITPDCERTLYYSVGNAEIHFDQNLSGCDFKIYRSQQEGDFLYYTYSTGLAQESCLRCPLIEGDYLLIITVPSDTDSSMENIQLTFTIDDPDMDENQSFDTTQWSFYFLTDSSLTEDSNVFNSCGITDRTVVNITSYTFSRRDFMPGDVDKDGSVNANDAAEILVNASNVGAGHSSDFSAMQCAEGDLDGDGNCNANDAALVLTYAAASASGSFQGTIAEYIRETNE